ncbi:MAG TPA: hypothetical protein DCR93_30590 [Cytophagales bacterium]|nr:hypothetical protein [Cytophagales bacterium]
MRRHDYYTPLLFLFLAACGGTSSAPHGGDLPHDYHSGAALREQAEFLNLQAYCQLFGLDDQVCQLDDRSVIERYLFAFHREAYEAVERNEIKLNKLVEEKRSELVKQVTAIDPKNLFYIHDFAEPQLGPQTQGGRYTIQFDLTGREGVKPLMTVPIDIPHPIGSMPPKIMLTNSQIIQVILDEDKATAVMDDVYQAPQMIVQFSLSMTADSLPQATLKHIDFYTNDWAEKLGEQVF